MVKTKRIVHWPLEKRPSHSKKKTTKQNFQSFFPLINSSDIWPWVSPLPYTWRLICNRSCTKVRPTSIQRPRWEMKNFPLRSQKNIIFLSESESSDVTTFKKASIRQSKLWQSYIWRLICHVDGSDGKFFFSFFRFLLYSPKLDLGWQIT